MDRHCKYSLTCFGCCCYNFPLLKMFRRIQNILHFQASKQEYCNSLVTAVAVWLPHRTPLHAAAFADHMECLQLLLSHSAQVNAVDHAGKTALMMAAQNGHVSAVGKCILTPAYLQGEHDCGYWFQVDDQFFLGKLRRRKLLTALHRNSTFTQLKKTFLLGYVSMQRLRSFAITWVLFPLQGAL